ncbi:bifunctional phosphoribosylaminoimidazolecarboxamide formyltransferase/IMP cyclohydrolase [Candidatus Enterococcus clewellii]|uniref:Bifunctional purine biosynthesis protein PurH n=1 Tax=Candidatus Enterococcus clewellii TaxID=1834193 RepID=A0A242KAT6_9ENTE|nr:bifunctional phosphoribosylaminoimidazolecarboxamide formyltransferase/IMP cyclohydrolase [Enterococcus sp. 9E7_DIV0242]OTP18281.1 phosphoribosylaminoimidazolecarboxamide formyltransferase/IMP cyclohydrolase [Enterococcus sp. 9E7_DIV0242]
MTKKRALISVSDKTGVADFAKRLAALGVEIISTGGTKTMLEQAGIPTIGIEEVTNFPEMMDGRVKTLHPKIHGGLLGRRDIPEHMAAMNDHDIQPIDIVCVNLYPFKETIQKPGTTVDEAIENIDIGGPSMLRSAAKNHQFVTVVVDPIDYGIVLGELSEGGDTTATTRQKLAAKVFRHTAAYDALIAGYLTELTGENEPESLTLTYELKQSLRYGENSHQQAAFYQEALPVPFSIASAKQLHGKELSYNNIKDGDAAIRIAREFDQPAVVAVKHMNPCGIGIGEDLFSAYTAAYEADPVSIFGGIIVLNREVDEAVAEKMHQLFLEIIIAPSFSDKAFEILSAKKNLRLMTLDFTQKDEAKDNEKVSVLGGLLVQNQDIVKEERVDWKVVTKRQPTEEEWEALAFSWKAVKHVKSNAIVIANAHQTIGIGAGQMNRVGSVQIAVAQAGEKITDAVLASDAYFPMGDSVEYAGEHGIKAIIQPGGSIRDQESIDMADKYGIAMVFTDIRHFRH